MKNFFHHKKGNTNINKDQ